MEELVYSKSKVLVSVCRSCAALEKQIYSMNDERTYALLSGSDWLVEQYDIGLGVARDQLYSLYAKAGCLVVEGLRSDGSI